MKYQNKHQLFISIFFLIFFGCVACNSSQKSISNYSLEIDSNSSKLFPIYIYRQEESKHGYIDRAGKIIIKPQFDSAEEFSNGLANVLINKQDAYIDRTGQIVFQPESESSYSFADGLALIRIKDKYGYIDRTGKIVIPPQFTRADSFSEGLAAVKIDDKYGYINKVGEVVIPPQFDEVAQQFNEGLAWTSVDGFFRNKYGYIDKTGSFVWSFKY